jgi:hypothetical protein
MEKYIEEEITFKELADRLGIKDLNEPQIFDMTELGYEILSYDTELKVEVWEPLEAYVVKENSETHYKLGELCGTAAHKVYHEGSFIRLDEHPDAIEAPSPIQVVDCQVGNTHNYLAGGQINHNTTTPGGAAIPYACSTRIRLYGGSQILDEKTKEVIGIAVKAKTIKNKVARPFREAEFEIHFGIGVREDQQAFDAFRRWCDAQGPVKMENGEQVSVAGSGAWKSFLVTDKDGTTLIEEKWQGKADFGSRVYYNQKYEKYVTALLDAAFVVTAEHDAQHPTYVDVDSESYEDVRSLAHS